MMLKAAQAKPLAPIRAFCTQDAGGLYRQMAQLKKSEYMKKYREARHKHKINPGPGRDTQDYKHQYYQAHKDKLSQHKRNYYQQNKEKFDSYYRENRAQYSLYKRSYYERNKDILNQSYKHYSTQQRENMRNQLRHDHSVKVQVSLNSFLSFQETIEREMKITSTLDWYNISPSDLRAVTDKQARRAIRVLPFHQLLQVRGHNMS